MVCSGIFVAVVNFVGIYVWWKFSPFPRYGTGLWLAGMMARAEELSNVCISFFN